MQNEGMIEDLVHNLTHSNPQLKMLCASAIFRLAELDESRYRVKLHGGLEPLVELVSEGSNYDNKVFKRFLTLFYRLHLTSCHIYSHYDALEDSAVKIRVLETAGGPNDVAAKGQVPDEAENVSLDRGDQRSFLGRLLLRTIINLSSDSSSVFSRQFQLKPFFQNVNIFK